jgi:hypothetical protein
MTRIFTKSFQLFTLLFYFLDHLIDIKLIYKLCTLFLFLKKSHEAKAFTEKCKKSRKFIKDLF